MPRIRRKSAIITSMNAYRNTKGVKCGSLGGTTCCPHQNIDEKGRYAATTKPHELTYRGLNYELWTCCDMCASEMQKLAKSNVRKFDEQYVNAFFDLGSGYQNQLILKNKHTGKVVQIARQMPSITKRTRRTRTTKKTRKTKKSKTRKARK